MPYDWTDQQKDAIYSHSKDILVSAGAGSGKTAVLIERLMRKITREKSPLSVNRILLVTYTNEAAGQLKEKIRNAISDAMAADQTNKHLNRQYMLIPQATVTTIHGFCLEIVKKYHAKLGLPPKIRPSDDVQTNLLMNQVADLVIDAYYSGLPGYDDIEDFVSFADNFITLQDSKLTQTVIQIYMKLSEMPEGKDFLLKSLKEYEKAENNFEETVWADILLDDMKREYTYHHALMTEACESLEDGGDYSEFFVPLFKKSKDACEEILDLIGKKDVKALEKSLDLTNYNGNQERPTKKIEANDNLKHFKKCRANLRDASKNYQGLYFNADKEAIKESAKASAKILSDLHKLLSAFERRYSFEKKRRGIVDFADIIRYAYSLLVDENGNATDIAHEVGTMYDEVCIDEYQDVNKIQDDIFSAISHSNNRFMVGDIKQSIYSFRGSMPEIFAAYRKSPLVSHIDLNANFRCDSPIINFSNDVCRNLFKNLGHTFDYLDEDDLKCEKKGGGSAPVEVICIEKTKKPKEDATDVEVTLNEEAEYIADRVEDEIKRGVKPSEIAILAMTKYFFKEVIASLEARGIKARDVEAPDLLTSPEVIVLLSFLQTIDNPSKDIPLVATLKSPLFNFTLSDLALIKRKNKAQSLYHSLLSYTKENNFPKGKRFLEKLNEYRAMLNEPVDRIIWHVMYDSGLMYYSSKESGKEGTDKLLAFYELGRTFENGTFKGLYNFLRSINEIIEMGGTLEAPKGPDGDDVVKLMTVHKSKGLEFETVILCNTNKEFSKKELMKSVLINSKSGVSFKLTDSTGLVSYTPVFKKIANMSYKRERDDESIRCLYVALTRAKRKLITVGVYDSDEALYSVISDRKYAKIKGGYVYSKRPDFMSWMILAHPDLIMDIVRPSERENVKATSVLPDTDKNIDTPHFDEDRIERLSEMYKERFSFKYPLENARRIPAKLSVSRLYPAILDEYDDSTDISTVKTAKLTTPSFVSKKKRSGSDIGTATHQFMQFCSFDLLKNSSVRAEIERLKEKGFLDTHTASLVSENDVERFLKTPLFEALTSSKDLRRELRFNVRFKASSFTELHDGDKDVENETVLVQGVIDCIYMNDDGTYTVLDYKTDSTDKCATDEEAEQMLIERHRQQLSYYKKATEIITSKAVSKVILYSFSLGRTIEITDDNLLDV